MTKKKVVRLSSELWRFLFFYVHHSWYSRFVSLEKSKEICGSESERYLISTYDWKKRESRD